MHPFVVGKLIRGITRNIDSFINTQLKKRGLTKGHFEYLFTIADHEGLSQMELADMMNLGKTGIAKAVKRLMDQELIYRVADEHDKRQVALFVTDKGYEALDYFKPIASQMERKVFNNLTNDELDTLHYLLDKIYNNTKDI